MLATIEALDKGNLRVASPPADPAGEWTTHAWIKQAILLYFAMRGMETMEVGPFEFHDKIPLKKGLDAPASASFRRASSATAPSASPARS